MAREFWEEGLRFECARCSACCRHEPGFVFLSARDIIALVGHLGIGFREFVDAYTKAVDVGTGHSLSLVEKPGNDCVFWGDSGCAVYPARPVQCSTYPFWSGILESAADWERESADCPGIGGGAVVPRDAIAGKLVARRADPPLVLEYDLSWGTVDETTILGRARLDTDAAVAGETEEQDIVDHPEDRP